MYVVCRKDLSGPQIAVQSAHSCIECARKFPDYLDDHPSLILCGVDNEPKLQKCLEHIQSLGVRCFPFYENDLDNQLTSFATEPVTGDTRKLFKKLQLIRGKDLQGGAA